MSNSNDKRLEQVELLLRARGPAPLGEDFRGSVMRAAARLPHPALTAPRSALATVLALMGPLEWAALSVVLACCCALALPGAGQWIAATQLELALLTVSVGVGDTALTASALSMAALGIGAALLAAVGVFSAKNRLVGA